MRAWSVGWWHVRKACRRSGLITINARSACAQGQPSRSSHEGSPREDLPQCSPVAFSSPRRCSRCCPSRPSRRGRNRHSLQNPPPPSPLPRPRSPRPPAPQLAKTNLNTATAAELDKLPQIGPAPSKAIIEARAKAKFKNWDDFVARKVVPADAAVAIKDVVSF